MGISRIVAILGMLSLCGCTTAPTGPYWSDAKWQADLVSHVSNHITYPEHGWKEGLPSGTGTVGFTYDQGQLRDAYIVKTTGSLLLDKALIDGVNSTVPPQVNPQYGSTPHDFQLTFDLNPDSSDLADALNIYLANVKYPDDQYPSQAAIIYVDGTYLDGQWKDLQVRVRQGGTEETSAALLKALRTTLLPAAPELFRGVSIPVQFRYCVSRDYQFCLLNTLKNFGDFHGVSVTLSPWKSPSKDYQQTLVKAEAGDIAAEEHLGELFEKGEGAPVDWGQAVSWYRKAALSGSEVAQNRLNHVYAQGLGVPWIKGGPIGYLATQAEAGAPDAQAFMGWWYLWSNDIVPDDQKGATWLKKAADQGYGTAAEDLGLIYHAGRGVPKDMTQSISWLQKAASDGYYSANDTIGYIYDAGLGVPVDPIIAASWYRKASPDSSAQCNLLRLNMLGLIAPRSPDEAAQWQKLAKEGMDCVNDIAWHFATSSDPTRRNPTKAMELAKQALAKKSDDWRWLDTLAAAQAAAGDYASAVKTQQDVLDRLLQLNSASPSLPSVRKRLMLYKAGKIYTEDDVL